MRRSKEIMVLIALFAAMAAFVLWYVADRRAKNRAGAPPAAAPAAGSIPAADPRALAPAPPPVNLAKTDGKTVDFSSGQPVVKDSAEDQAALAAALKDMADATKDVTFEAPKKPADAAPPPAQP